MVGHVSSEEERRWELTRFLRKFYAQNFLSETSVAFCETHHKASPDSRGREIDSVSQGELQQTHIAKGTTWRVGRTFAIYYRYCGKEDCRFRSQSKALCLLKNLYQGRKYYKRNH